MLQFLQTALEKGCVHSLLKGAGILKMENCTPADFDKALHLLGGCVKDLWEEQDSRFAVCEKDEHSFVLSFHERTGKLHITEDAKENFAPLRAEEGAVKPLITQGRLLYYAYDCGMLYVIRLSDGRFVIIDGGMAEYEEPEHFLHILRSQNTLPGVPEIAAWFITHAHDDHFTLFVEVCKRFYDQLKIDSIVYNWAAPDRIRWGSDVTEFHQVLATHPEIKPITPHTGMRFMYPGAEFRVLYTHEDRMPDALPNFNETSTVMRMDMQGKRVMWTGDCMWETADWLCEQYDPQVLKSDILQVAHHGYSGGSDAFYRAVDAEVLLWPCPDFWFYTQSILPCNRYLLESPNLKATYMTGREETVLDVNAPALQSDPYAPCKKAKPGDVLFDSDFASGAIFDLGWAGITGGRTNYQSAALSLTEEGLHMASSPDHYSVTEWMQPGMLTASYTVDMRIKCCRQGTAALFWNYETPWEYDENEALPLLLSENVWQDIHLDVNCEKGEARFVCGDTVRLIPFTPAKRKGLYLILKDASVTLRHLRVTR